MNRTEKGEIVAGLTDRFSRAATIYVTDFTGLRVKNLTELRRRLRAAGGEYVVVKNTLALRALQAASPGGLADVLRGPTGLVFVETDPLAPAKILAEFQREFERPAVKAGWVDGRRVTPDEVKRLAHLPSRDQLLGQLGGAWQAPLA
ncbi:MAG: 50S ribosomal protein L10, partial [Gemmatimonadetes bacterium]|nr:50S ribosomal protein L10 [Gemmatimonadota bacterium]